MLLFSGTACFSPSVPPTLLRSWATHGGTVARAYQERRTAQYYFCSGTGDPWVARLSVQGLIVFDASWIARCVREQFCVAIAPYVLDAVQVQKKTHGKRRASERLSSPPASPLRAPKRARLRSSRDHEDGVKRVENVPHLDLAAKYRSLRRARSEQTLIPGGAEADFLQTIYNDAEVGSRRFTVDAVLRSLEDVSVAGVCVIECGEVHLGRRFSLACEK